MLGTAEAATDADAVAEDAVATVAADTDAVLPSFSVTGLASTHAVSAWHKNTDFVNRYITFICNWCRYSKKRKPSRGLKKCYMQITGKTPTPKPMMRQ